MKICYFFFITFITFIMIVVVTVIVTVVVSFEFITGFGRSSFIRILIFVVCGLEVWVRLRRSVVFSIGLLVML